MSLQTNIPFILVASIALAGCSSKSTGGDASCASLCVGEPSCANTTQSAVGCVDQCVTEQTACESTGHASDFQAFLNCAASATFTCTADGPQTSSCAEQSLALALCTSTTNRLDAGLTSLDGAASVLDASLSDSKAPLRDGQGADTSVATPDVFAPIDAPSSTCSPSVLVDFAPVAITSNQETACTAALVTTFIDACLGASSSSTTCQTWQGGTGAITCEQCILTGYAGATVVTPGANPPPTAVSPWGPLIEVSNPGSQLFLNLGECITLSDPANTACGSAFNAQLQCEYESCAANCPLPTSGTTTSAMADYAMCAEQADENGCAAYANATDSACANLDLDGGPASVCFSALSDATDNGAFAKVLEQQCGG